MSDKPDKPTPKLTLADHHREALYKRGIFPDTIDRARLATIPNKNVVDHRGEGPWLIIPSNPLPGVVVGPPTLRPDKPDKDAKTGRVMKYVVARGSKRRLYLASDPSLVVDTNKPLILVEGELNALIISQYAPSDHVVIASGGVNCWYSKEQLHEDFSNVTFIGRIVYIIPDADIAANKEAAKTINTLAKLLLRQGADVKLVRVPPMEGQPKAGPDDYIVAQDDPAKALLQLLASGTAPRVQRMTQKEAAQWFLSTLSIDDIEPRLIGGEVHAWRSGIWKMIQRVEVESTMHIDTSGPQFDKNSDGEGAAKIMYKIADNVDGRKPPIGVMTRTGFITVHDNEVVIEDPSPDHLATWLLDLDYDPEAQTPLWTETLHDLLEPDLIDVLQEMFGAALFRLGPTCNKAFVLTGDGANGKSTILNVLRSMFDPRGVTAIPPTQWSKFRLCELARAHVNLVSEMPSTEITDTEIFKKVVSGDLVSADRKKISGIEFCPHAIHVFLPNELPAVSDHSHGFWRRWIVIPFDKIIPESKQDAKRGSRIIDSELPGILTWAVIGAQRLIAQEYKFTTVESSIRKREEWQLDTDHVKRFIVEATYPAVHRDRWTKASNLYATYRAWSSAQGVQAVSQTKFGRRLTRLNIDRDERKNGRYWSIVVEPHIAEELGPISFG